MNIFTKSRTARGIQYLSVWPPERDMAITRVSTLVAVSEEQLESMTIGSVPFDEGLSSSAHIASQINMISVVAPSH